MPRAPQVLIYVGIKNCVVALDDRTGEEAWRTELKGSDYVSVMWDGTALIAANAGEVWRLDARTGGVQWRNELKGLGRGLVSLASSRRATDTSDTDGARREETARRAGRR